MTSAPPPADPGSEAFPEVLSDRFVPVDTPLRSGGQAIVFHAVRRRPRQEVAVKVMRRGLSGPVAIGTFDREAQILANLDHEGIVRLLDFVTDGADRPVIVTEWLPGGTLADRLEDGPLTVAETLPILRRIAEAMHRAHLASIVHRDLKPSNVLFRADGSAVITDFGIAYSDDGSDTSPPAPPPAAERPDATTVSAEDRTVVDPTLLADEPSAWFLTDLASAPPAVPAVSGTPGYMSPEQAWGHAQDRRSDLFAFGCLAVAMLSGRPPWAGLSIESLREAFAVEDADLTGLPPGTPPHLVELIGDCLRRTAARRPAGFDVVLERLDAADGRPAASLHNLPTASRGWIDRPALEESVMDALAAQRIVLLRGPGGIGKTRLARRLTRALASGYSDGACFVSLDSALDDDAVIQLVSSALDLAGVPENPANAKDPIHAITAVLSDRSRLLVLDGCDRVVSGVQGLVERIRSACPRVDVLLTSRASLARDWGRVDVEPMSVPPRDATLEDLSTFESSRLFIDRLHAVAASRTLSAADAPAVAAICAAVSGVPLAVELVASMGESMSVVELARVVTRLLGRIHDDTPAVARHRSVSAMIEWSYDRLEPSAQAVLAAASIFEQGWTHAMMLDLLVTPDGEAPNALDVALAGHGDALDRLDVELIMNTLVRGTLFRYDDRTEVPRYQLLFPIQVFARGALNAWPAEARAALAARHARVVLEAVTDAAIDTAQLLAELPNARRTLDWSTGPEGDPLIGEAIARAYAPTWYDRLLAAEGLASVRRVIDALRTRGIDSQLPPGGLTRVAGILAWASGDSAAAVTWYERSLAEAVAGGDLASTGRSLTNLGAALETQNALPAARAVQRAATRVLEETSDATAARQAAMNLGVVLLREGRVAEAKDLMLAARAAAAAITDPGDDVLRAIAFADHNLGIAEILMDSGRTALPLLLRSATGSASFGNDHLLVQSGRAAALAVALAADADAAGRLAALADEFADRRGVRDVSPVIAEAFSGLRAELDVASRRRRLSPTLDDAGGDRIAWFRRRILEAIEAASGGVEPMS